jgi:hypothetical protein
MRPVAFTLFLAGILLLAGCRGTTSDATSRAQPACVCGTHEARVHGCHHPACASGAGNPDNPNCHCAPLVPSGAPKNGG